MNAITVAALNELIANHEDVTIVDVREREQYMKGHIPMALAVPIGALEHATDTSSVACDEKLARARGTTVVVCCDDERRSRVAAGQLERLGFTAVYYLAGGLSCWQTEGFPLVPG